MDARCRAAWWTDIDSTSRCAEDDGHDGRHRDAHGDSRSLEVVQWLCSGCDTVMMMAPDMLCTYCAPTARARAEVTARVATALGLPASASVEECEARAVDLVIVERAARRIISAGLDTTGTLAEALAAVKR